MIDATGTVVCVLGLVIPFPVAFLLNAGLGLGSALPSTPGYVGIYQFVAARGVARAQPSDQVLQQNYWAWSGKR